MCRKLWEVGLTDGVFETGAGWWEGCGDRKISSREFGREQNPRIRVGVTGDDDRVGVGLVDGFVRLKIVVVENDVR